MKNRIIVNIIFIIIYFFYPLVGQEGIPFSSHFYPENEAYSENISICNDDVGNIVLANRKGIIVFDGYEWNLVTMHDIPTVVKYNSNNKKVYIGGRNII